MVIRTLSTTSEVIDELGGTGGLARQLGCSVTVVSNWRTGTKSGRGRFPPEWFLEMTRLLEAKGFTAEPGLWCQRETVEAAE